MACTILTKGRGLDCSRIAGGVKFIYFGVFDQFNTPITSVGLPQTAGELTDISMVTGSKIFRYAMPLGTASVTETITGSTENGTIFYTPVVNIMLNKLTKEDQNEIKLLGQSKVVIFAQLNQRASLTTDTIIALGVSNGMNLNAGTIDSGAAWGDRNGYTLTFDGLEPIPFPVVADYPPATGPLTNAGFDGFTVDES